MKKHTPLKSKFNSAFSLVELLVVIAVIAVIAAIAIPNITGTREAAVAAQQSYDQAALDRAVANAEAAGATPAQIATLRANGSVTIQVGGRDIVFTTGADTEGPDEE
jgi:prepilin-type N-terminal cleavage/methylation domain-containing protein